MYNLLDKIAQTILLFDFYGQLLTPKQIEIMNMYYNDDLSLSEISEHLSISRQGVHDSLKRAEHALSEYEEKLGLVKMFIEQKENMDKVFLMLDDIFENDKEVDNIKKKIKEIKDYITNIL